MERLATPLVVELIGTDIMPLLAAVPSGVEVEDGGVGW